MTKLDDIYEVIKIFEKHHIKLIAYGGTSVVLIRDHNCENLKAANFVMDCNKYLDKLLPDCNGTLKNQTKIKKELIKDLNNSGWYFFRGDSWINQPFYEEKDDWYCLAIKLKNKKNFVFDIWPYMMINNKYYFGLRDNNKYDKEFFENPVEIKQKYKKWPHKFSILIPNYCENILNNIYDNWRIPNKNSHHRPDPMHIKLKNNSVVKFKKLVEKKVTIPDEYLNFNVLKKK